MDEEIWRREKERSVIKMLKQTQELQKNLKNWELAKNMKKGCCFFYILQIDFGTHVLCIPIILLHALHISYWTIF